MRVLTVVIGARDQGCVSCALIRRASHFGLNLFCLWSDKPWEMFTLSLRKSSQSLGQREKGGRHGVQDVLEEDKLGLQGVNQEMRKQKEAKAKIPSSGFSLKPFGES